MRDAQAPRSEAEGGGCTASTTDPGSPPEAMDAQGPSTDQVRGWRRAARMAARASRSREPCTSQLAPSHSISSFSLPSRATQIARAPQPSTKAGESRRSAMSAAFRQAA